MLGRKSKVLHGEDAIYDTLLGNEYRISHKSFYQVNPLQTEALYEKAIEVADLDENDTVMDAFSGIGTIALSLARNVKRVIGLESVGAAVEDARENAVRNGIDNAEFHVGKVEDIIGRFKNENVDVLFVDPPRKGCKREFLDAVLDMDIDKIVYVSCNVSTLARDLNILVGDGYIIKSVTPFDMFPQTSHIESVTLLEKSRD
jgi:23S rRNA (uracil1939-C5)-methyltransferase